MVVVAAVAGIMWGSTGGANRGCVFLNREAERNSRRRGNRGDGGGGGDGAAGFSKICGDVGGSRCRGRRCS